jgi:pyruvate/2-oxoacid:ferredoxin oxidoreductase alpha subunit/NAD-dependent dihydropyrimidine dehydrogenase PreA subunit
MTVEPAPRTPRSRPKPFLFPQLCKACGRCIEACPKDCIELGTEIEPSSGFTPVTLDLELCNGCGLCLTACPEPYGLLPIPLGEERAPDSLGELLGPDVESPPMPLAVPDRRRAHHASAVGALLAGCRHFFGYPITPSTEGAELMARHLGDLGGVFVQAVSEVAAVNMMYGCGAAGLRSMTFTSSPGFSLMLEGISYMIGAEVPGVVVNVMRGGPGLGNIGPEQADVKLVCRGLGHGNTHALVLAPASPQEMLELTMEAFDLAFAYRNPVILVGDGYLAQTTGRVTLPERLVEPGLPEWVVAGDREHRRNLVCSIFLSETDLERHNLHLEEKYRRMSRREQRSEEFRCEDAEWLLVACNTPARMAKGAVEALRAEGMPVGLFRPITLWPFPADALARLLDRGVRGVVVVEAGPGQFEDELRLALSHAGVRPPPIAHVRRMGGVLPGLDAIVDRVRRFPHELRHQAEEALDGHGVLQAV